MKSNKLIFAVTLSAASFSAFAGTWSSRGEPAAPNAEARTVIINATTKYVNVDHDEDVKFVANGRELEWKFDGTARSFNLSQISPQGLIDHPVVVYIADANAEQASQYSE